MPQKTTVHLRKDRQGLQKAAEILRKGGLVVFPTETVYGIGANAFNEAAVRSIFKAKGRPQDNPLIVHIADWKMLDRIAEQVPVTAKALFRSFSPGPLTVVLKKKGSIPGCVSAGLDTVAVRVPSHPSARSLIRACGFPLAAPSANRSGRPSPTTYAMALSEMDGRADAVIDGGNCDHGLESTVVAVEGGTVTILRPGAVTREMIVRALGNKNKFIVLSGEKHAKGAVRSPGTKYTHYKPKALVVLVDPKDTGKIAGWIKKKKCKKPAFLHAGNLKGVSDALIDVRFSSAADYARKLYRTFHDLDALGADVIFAAAVPEKGIGIALMNRLLKASGGKTV
jgi:L-threonylcarbamoyladenylate synthase